MAKSFFERLTGSVRVSEESPTPYQDSRLAATTLPKTAKKKVETLPEDTKVIHPVAAGEKSSNQETAVEEPVEEGQLTVDIYDDGSYIIIQSTVAGVKPEEIDISLQDETLTIRGSRKRAQEINEGNFYYRELYWGAFSRSIILPEEVEFQKAEAAIKNGLLTIRLPKKDKGEKKIRVKIE